MGPSNGEELGHTSSLQMTTSALSALAAEMGFLQTQEVVLGCWEAKRGNKCAIELVRSIDIYRKKRFLFEILNMKNKGIQGLC